MVSLHKAGVMLVEVQYLQQFELDCMPRKRTSVTVSGAVHLVNAVPPREDAINDMDDVCLRTRVITAMLVSWCPRSWSTAERKTPRYTTMDDAHSSCTVRCIKSGGQSSS
jgi:hypothetical protein